MYLLLTVPIQLVSSIEMYFVQDTMNIFKYIVVNYRITVQMRRQLTTYVIKTTTIIIL